MHGRILLICLLIVGVVLLVCGLRTLDTEATPIRYEGRGKVVFESEADYASFKRYIGQEGVHIVDITVLSSELPIVVDFCVGYDVGVDFPYGEQRIIGRYAGPEATALLLGAFASWFGASLCVFRVYIWA